MHVRRNAARYHDHACVLTIGVRRDRGRNLSAPIAAVTTTGWHEGLRSPGRHDESPVPASKATEEAGGHRRRRGQRF